MIQLNYNGTDGCRLFAFAAGPPCAELKDKPVLVLMHGGGPDHRSLVPLATRLFEEALVVLPDVRGYGRSLCPDPARHTWAQYSDDVVALIERLQARHVVVGGAGIGATISLRTALTQPSRVSGLILISLEDIEDDAGKEAEIAFMESFAERVRTQGVESAWAPILGNLSPIIGTMVREAMPDADPASLAAAAAIGRDRAFRSVDELLASSVPTLLFAGTDWRHPAALTKALAEWLPRGRLGKASMSAPMQTTHDFAQAFAPEIIGFLRDLRTK